MAALPPELAQLDEQYMQLTASVDAGHITIGNAVAALDAMIAVDPLGGVWRIDSDGDFTRAASHGAPPVKTDPSAWPNPGMPGPMPVPMAPPGGNNLFTPPVQPTPMMTSPGAPVGAPPWATGLDAGMPSPGYTGGFEESKSLGGNDSGKKSGKNSKAGKEPKGKRLPSDNLSGGPKSLPGPLAWVAANKKPVIIGVVVLILVAVAVVSFKGGGTPEPEQTLPAATGTSEALPVDTPTSEDPGTPTPDQPSTDPSNAAPVAAPTATDFDAMKTALASGATDGLIINAANTQAAARAAVILSGAQARGYTVNAKNPVKAKKGAGVMRQDVTVKDANGTVLWTGAFFWKNVDGGWLLTAPPVFQATK